MKFVIISFILIVVSSVTIKRKSGSRLDVTSFIGNPILSNLINEMRKYISTPWKGQQAWNIQEYMQEMKKNPNLVCEGDNSYNDLCQSHAGNLLEHSQWTAYQIKAWSDSNSKIMEGVDLNTALVAAFTHDLGKGGDCIFDMYSQTKYDSKGDGVHPEYCGDLLKGKTNFHKCNGNVKGEIIDLKSLLTEVFPGIDQRKLALAAYMHWEFGRINKYFTEPELETATNNYLTKFNESCAKVGLTPDISLLRLCIAVSCADIAGSSNSRVSQIAGVLPQIYKARDIWVFKKMDVNYEGHINRVIGKFTHSSKK